MLPLHDVEFYIFTAHEKRRKRGKTYRVPKVDLVLDEFRQSAWGDENLGVRRKHDAIGLEVIVTSNLEKVHCPFEK